MECITNRAMYQPGATVRCTVTGIPRNATQILCLLMFLDTQKTRLLKPVADDHIVIEIPLPDVDFTGYLLKVQAIDCDGKPLETTYHAVDCSSSWTRFPRYGYVWDFTENADPPKMMAELNRYHINGIQFYDWQYRHHQPVAPDLNGWTDWSGRLIDGRKLRACLTAAHQFGMACMAYNMIYAANRTYLHDGSGVQPAWRLVKANGQDFTCDMDAALGDVGILQYFNLCNPDWQRYLFAKQNEVFQAFAFDGWHGDTIGENGPMMTVSGDALGYADDGQPIRYVKDGYTPFLNAAKQAIGNHWLAFNPVGAQGIENVNRSHVDVLYTEFWPWDCDADGLPYTGYYALHKAIRQAAEQSGGKSLIVAAYVNYRNQTPNFNAPAVRLLDSVVFASGGARIELGNGDGMLSDEYFPADRNKRMDDELQTHMRRLYDFIVAYQNLLRDGQTPVQCRVDIAGVPVSYQGTADTVWGFASEDEQCEVYQLINLLGTDEGWRDEQQTKHSPTLIQNANVTIYTERDVQTVLMASPDDANLSMIALPFTRTGDQNNPGVAFAMPQLAYWNMIVLR